MTQGGYQRTRTHTDTDDFTISQVINAGQVTVLAYLPAVPTSTQCVPNIPDSKEFKVSSINWAGRRKLTTQTLTHEDCAGPGECITAVGFVGSTNDLVSNFNYVSQAFFAAARLGVMEWK